LEPEIGNGQRAAMGSANRLKLGLFGANCSSGRAITTVPERWSGSWPDCVRLAQLADRAGIEIKFEGNRMHARLDRGAVRLLTRIGLYWTQKCPTIGGSQRLLAMFGEFTCDLRRRQIQLSETRTANIPSAETPGARS